ncbi:hypothetical protein CHS0354_026288 [Potamilus streckersoni]|uniref:C1q domain-containing protein n=1 Tax=Potamilus streckersoni TaxID=2493646 RepID=A0AAE0TFC6_9BIVA|nr:hypothetical protein CHS0354_026288 [Potamilus streckersoni]
MLSVRLVAIFATFASVRTNILEKVNQADLEAVRIRLMEEKAKRLLLQNDIEVMMLQFEELKRKCDQRDRQANNRNVTLETQSIGFTATLSPFQTHVSEQTVIFDRVRVNKGNCYSNSTGRFVAPFRGLYSFSVTVLSYQTVHLIIMKENEEIGRAFSGNSVTGSGSVTVVTEMNKDQVVFVKEYPGKTEQMHGGDWSTFTGLLQGRYD